MFGVWHFRSAAFLGWHVSLKRSIGIIFSFIDAMIGKEKRIFFEDSVLFSGAEPVPFVDMSTLLILLFILTLIFV